jgi:hypothetical protein
VQQRADELLDLGSRLQRLSHEFEFEPLFRSGDGIMSAAISISREVRDAVRPLCSDEGFRAFLHASLPARSYTRTAGDADGESEGGVPD